jgi:uncharacterized protein
MQVPRHFLLNTTNSPIINTNLFKFFKRYNALLKEVLVMMMMVIVPEVLFAQPTQDGFVQYRHENGQVSSEGYLVEGKPEGLWKNYYDTGVLRSEGERLRFELQGIWKFYGPDGALLSEISYARGKREGLLRKYDSGGILMSEENYVADVKQGPSVWYYANGSPQKRILFENGKEHGVAHTYAEDGRVIEILTYAQGVVRRREQINQLDADGQRQGKWKEFTADMKVKAEGYYVDGRKQGVFKEYDGQGNLRTINKYDRDSIDVNALATQVLEIRNTYHPNGEIATIGSYNKAGGKEGLFRAFSEEGKLERSAIYSNDRVLAEGPVDERGALTGMWKENYASGEKRAEGEYKEGKREGEWTYFYREGQVEQKGKYNYGLAQNQWVWFYPNGERRREENYRKGKEDGTSAEYDEEGKVISQGEYIDGSKEGPWIYAVGDHTEKGNYKEGYKDGPWEHYYVDGKKNFSGSFSSGEPEGKHKWYWPNGELRMEGKYSGGMEQGDWPLYDELGNLIATYRYRNGQLMRVDGEKVPPPYAPGESAP